MTEHQTNDDLLSAYFDGEATPDERAAAERLLHASPEARRELAEIGEVADLLRSLPHARLPEHFAAQVLARAEREMLLAAPAGTSPASSHRRRRARWFALGSLIATAAAVIVLTSLMGPPERGEGIAGRGEGAVAEPVDEEIAMAPASEFRGPRGGRAPADFADGEVEKLEDRIAGAAGPATDAPALEEELPPSNTPPPPAPSAAPFEAAPRQTLDGARGSGRGNLVRESIPPPMSRADRAAPEPATAGASPAIGAVRDALDLDNVQVGEIVRFAEESDDGVAVVELTVVDVRQAAGTLDVLLVQNGRSLIADEAAGGFGGQAAQSDDRAARVATSDKDARQRAADNRPRPRAGELLAVYVESPGSRLALALEEMQRRGLLENPQLVAPVDPQRVAVALEDREAAEPAPGEPAELEDLGENRTTLAAAVERQKGQSAEREASQREAPSGRGRAQPQAPDAQQPPESNTAPPPPAIALRAGDGVAQAVEPALGDGPTFRLQFRPDETLLAGGDAASRPRRFSAQRSRQALGEPSAVPEGPRAEAAASSGAPLRVIFVFRQGG